MKNITTLLISLLFMSQAKAQLLEAKPVALAIQQALSARLVLKDIEKVTGFYSTKSCLYVSDQIIVLKNYCVPRKEYPAKSYTIVSPKFGIIDLYQEEVDETLQKRDVRISTFPVPLTEAIRRKLKDYKTVADINALFEKVKNGPGCWSTNFSFYTQEAEASCNVTAVQDLELWIDETQNLTADQKAWANVMNSLDQKFKD